MTSGAGFDEIVLFGLAGTAPFLEDEDFVLAAGV
jgi:hypothetical protein